MGKPTLRDVADRSGFSITTVSQVLNDVPGKRIPDATRDRVRAAATELAYRPNRLAQGLRLQRSNTLGFVSDKIATTPYAGEVILGAQDAAAEHGDLLLLMNSNSDPGLEEREIRALQERQVDGIIFASEYHRVITPPDALQGTPAVLLDARSVRGDVSSVVPDEVGGALAAVRELIAAGHQRIAFLNNVDDIPATALRLQGFRQGLNEAGRRLRAGMVVTAASTPGAGYDAAQQLLDQPRAGRPTAIFCFNDRMAMGTYQAAAELGLRIPDDLSVVGFDNQELIAANLRPGLTTVALPHYAMGQWAVAALLDLIDAQADPSQKRQPIREEKLPCPLVRRASVGPPPRS
ncbi:MAG TPA: LacI family DNA-binding transcriptional regulator [Nakamurella multipartita]|nr:LacI family DNA-binding transcriptional regulator [Nakamurella multipartita]